MAFLAKSTVLRAYEVLSSIDEDKRQGLTQKVSALKYGIALGMYYKQNETNCDLKITDNRDTFATFVGRVVKINDNQCTKDFYTSIASNGRDYDCGSNFYSQSSVKESKTNTALTIQYPKRSGWKPVMDVSNQELIYKPDYIESSINFYLESSLVKYAFVIWLLRFENIETKNTAGLKEALRALITDEYCNVLLPDGEDGSDYFPVEYDEMQCELTDIDIKNMFSNQKKCLNSYQQIFYGAPGTGKSNTIKCEVDDKGKINFRVTFHPDSDYSTFVGCYKPTMKENIISKNNVEIKEEQIVYRFVPQAFTKAYISAWKTEEDVFLVIEEINRGNCAQIFGDLFQLLDRKNGVSQYPVDADTDLGDYIAKELADSSRTDYLDGVKEGKKLVLPKNLYIWATMNTSDQSLFPIDSAFKRRWDWKYMKITKGKDKNGNELDWKLDIKIKDINNEEKQVVWWDIIEKINAIIASMTSSADKQLGYFFCKADDEGKISKEVFVGKVLFYLWNDVFKDYGFEDSSLFTFKEQVNGHEETKELTFPDFYDEDGEDVNSERVADFVEKVMNWKKNSDKENKD